MTPLCNTVSTIFSLGFRKKKKKRHRVGKFSIRLPLSVRSLFCLFQTFTNDICWVCKSPTEEATNWPDKIKNFTRYQRLHCHWVKAKNPLGRLWLGLLQRGVSWSCSFDWNFFLNQVTSSKSHSSEYEGTVLVPGDSGSCLIPGWAITPLSKRKEMHTFRLSINSLSAAIEGGN